MIVISFFRNMESRLSTYLDQVKALDASLSGPVSRLIAVYGDCTDLTREALIRGCEKRRLTLELVEHNHGGPEWGSVENADRFRALSALSNAALDRVRPDDRDPIFYVESDLLWDATTVMGLEALLCNSHFDIVAPLIMCGDRFYDTYVFRKDGRRFSALKPYHPGLHPLLPTEVDSVGSAFLMWPNLARQVRMTDGVLVEFCNKARVQGFKIGVDPCLRIDHPEALWRRA